MAADAADGVNAYVEAIAGKDAFKRGQRNRVKFSNKRSRDAEGDEDMEDDHTDGPTSAGYSSAGKKPKNGKKEMSGRKGVGVRGVKEGRVRKGQGQKRGGRGK
jgi:ribosomal RNA-processing protein 12